MCIINIPSYGLALGAVGQSLLYKLLFPRVADWIVLIPLLLPWLTVWTISFCQAPPCGPRPFRYVLVFAMSWYGAATLLVEVLYLVLHPMRHTRWEVAVPRSLMYLGFLTFIVFVRFCIATRRYEKELLKNRGHRCTQINTDKQNGVLSVFICVH